MLPRPEIWKDHVLVRTPRRNYTADDYEALFDDMQEDDLLEKYRDARKYWRFEHPGVDVHCISGRGLLVPESVTLAGDRFDAGITSVLHYGEGDGRLHLVSMRSCRLFEAMRTDKRFSYQELEFEHSALVRDARAVRRILEVIQNIE